MAKVGIVMGSDSDMPVMAKAADILEKFGIDYEMTIISAHREPDVFFEYAKTAEEKGFKVIIAGAGMAAHLPGMCAAIFPMPVIGIPMHTTSLGGRDSLYSIVQMPSGIPVATVAINGGANAGILAAKILATGDPELLQKVKDYAAELKSQVLHMDSIQEMADQLKIVYTPLHGTGNIPARRVLKELGFNHVYVVKEQELPDGEFPTVSYPNPEAEEAFALGSPTTAIVAHGGTIMSILSAYGYPKQGYFEWQIKNGEYYVLTLEEEIWKKERHVLSAEKGLWTDV